MSTSRCSWSIQCLPTSAATTGFAAHAYDFGFCAELPVHAKLTWLSPRALARVLLLGRELAELEAHLKSIPAQLVIGSRAAALTARSRFASCLQVR